jgi:hypothetical protein
VQEKIAPILRNKQKLQKKQNFISKNQCRKINTKLNPIMETNKKDLCTFAELHKFEWQ